MLMLKMWKKQEGDFFCICTRSLTGQWKEHFIPKGEWSKAKELVQNNIDKDLYMCPHGFTDAQRRKDKSVDPKLLYADLDECDPRDLEFRPTIAIESSPGRYVGYWETDRPASEELNQRMTYAIEADVSGWDRTQVLRIPNTRNFKYSSSPRVRIMWVDGPTYKIDDLEKMLPSLAKLAIDNEELDEEAGAIFKKYEEQLTPWARKELMREEVTHGKRSEVIWKLGNQMIEAGMTREEAFKLLWTCAWNKFRERRDGADQLWRELDKAVSGHMLKKGEAARGKQKTDLEDHEDTEWDPKLVSMADVEIENIHWLVPGILAKKEMTIVEGDPGLGKSYFVQMIAGLICDGKRFELTQRYKPEQGVIVYFDMENTSSTVTKPRLVENGVEKLSNYFQSEESFSIDQEDRWEKMVEVVERMKPKLIVFDTINTYIGGADTYRSSETQQAMGLFKELAVRFDCSVVVLRHLTKGGGGKDKALYRGQGSIAFTGAARIVATVGRDPEDQNVRVVACTKNNISTPFRSFSYTIEGLPDTIARKNRSRLVWGEFTEYSSDDILKAPSEDQPMSNKQLEQCMDWLKEILNENGRMESKELYVLAENRNWSKSTVNRAAERIEVDKRVKGRGKERTSYWSLKFAG